MAYQVRFTSVAKRDLNHLWLSINAPESPAAVRWFLKLEQSIALLATSPRMGPVTHEDPHVLHLIYGNKPHHYRVLYEIDDAQKRILVLSIWHGKRLPPTSLKY
jgi:plasmid stabilization system protein ParE